MTVMWSPLCAKAIFGCYFILNSVFLVGLLIMTTYSDLLRFSSLVVIFVILSVIYNFLRAVLINFVICCRSNILRFYKRIKGQFGFFILVVYENCFSLPFIYLCVCGLIGLQVCCNTFLFIQSTLSLMGVNTTLFVNFSLSGS